MADLWRTISERHGELLSALGQHIEISLIALMIAVVIAIPLAHYRTDNPYGCMSGGYVVQLNVDCNYRWYTVILRTCLVSFKNYLQEGQYNHLKTAVKGTFTVFPKSPTFV